MYLAATTLGKARVRAAKKWESGDMVCKVMFNVQTQMREPLLNIADYLCWAVQRVFERGEVRYYEFVGDKIPLVVDLYDSKKYKGGGNYYRWGKNPLTTKKKTGPHSA